MLILFLLLFLAGSAHADVLDDLVPGRWAAISGNTISSVYPSPLPPDGNPVNIIDAWNGGFFDTARNRYVVMGGGDHDYAGNEIYGFSLSTFLWSRIAEPSANADIPAFNVNNGTTYADGKPNSRHNYAGFLYLPNTDRYMLHGGNLWGSAFASDTFQWNPNNGTWTQTSTSRSPCGNPGDQVFAAYDSNTGNVYVHVRNVLCQFNPNTNVWSQRGGDGSTNFTSTSPAPVFDKDRNQYCFIGNGATKCYDLNDSSTSTPLTTITTVGDTGIEGSGVAGAAYDTVSRKIVAWNGGTDVYTLDMTTRRWTKLTATAGGATPSTPTANGVFNRFVYVPSKNVFLVVNSTTTSVYAYKLPLGQTQISIPSQAWYKTTFVPTETTTLWPFSILKHMQADFRTVDRKLYLMGGDHQGNTPRDPYQIGEFQSGRNEGYTYDVATNRLTLIQSYCQSGIVYGRMDVVGWTYDRTRDRFWMIPGFQWEDKFETPTPNPSCNYALSGGDYRRGSAYYTPGTGNYLTGPGTWHVPNPAIQTFSGSAGVGAWVLHDPITDTLLKIRKSTGCGPGMLSYSIANNAWTDYGGGGVSCDNSSWDAVGSAIDVVGRRVFAISPNDPPVGNGTGNGQLNRISRGASFQSPGDYIVTCVTAFANGCTFSVVAPDKTSLANFTTSGVDGGQSDYTSSHINFSITDGSTDFIAGDNFVIQAQSTLPILAQWNIDSHTWQARATPPEIGIAEHRVVWDTVNNVLLWLYWADGDCDGSAGCQHVMKIYAWDPLTDQWSANLTSGTLGDGTIVKGRNSFYDPTNNVVVSWGVEHNLPGPTSFFLFRYGGFAAGGGDTTSPVVTITSPTSSPTYATGTSTINISGTASDNAGLSQITWRNEQGGNGTAVGTTSWSVSGITLFVGTNVLTVTATDTSGNTSTDVLTVTYTISDTTAPTVAIVTPTTNPTYNAITNTISLTGTASDTNGIVSPVTWSNSLGGSGSATGTTSWSVSSISLSIGTNVITISATDPTGNIGTDQISVTFLPPNPPTGLVIRQNG